MARPAAGIETYKNERLLWQTVLQQNKLTIKCPTRTKAMQLIQRLHAFRVLDRNNSFEGTNSIFDNYIIRHPNKDVVVVIEPRNILEELILLLPDGTTPDLQRAQRDINDLDRAKSDAFVRDAGLDRQEHKLQIDPNKPLDFDIE